MTAIATAQIPTTAVVSSGLGSFKIAKKAETATKAEEPSVDAFLSRVSGEGSTSVSPSLYKVEASLKYFSISCCSRMADLAMFSRSQPHEQR
jgi:hypothetical protein